MNNLQKESAQQFTHKTRKQIAVLIGVMIVAMGNNLLHASSLYFLMRHTKLVELNTISNWYSFEWIHAILVVLMIDVSVLLFMKHGNKTAASISALGIFIINILFLDVLADCYELSEYISHDSHRVAKLCSKILFSAFFSYTIHEFSKIVLRLQQKQQQQGSDIERIESEYNKAIKEIVSLAEALSEKKILCQNLTKQNKHLLDEMENWHRHESEIQSETNPHQSAQSEYKCECERIFSNQNALNAHKAHCPHKKENDDLFINRQDGEGETSGIAQEAIAESGQLVV